MIKWDENVDNCQEAWKKNWKMKIAIQSTRNQRIKVGAIKAPISRQQARKLQVSSGIARQNANQQVEEMISSRIPLTGSRVADPRCDPRASTSRIYLADPQKMTAASCSRIPVFQLTSSSIFRRNSMKAAWRIVWDWRNNSLLIQNTICFNITTHLGWRFKGFKCMKTKKLKKPFSLTFEGQFVLYSHDIILDAYGCNLL